MSNLSVEVVNQGHTVQFAQPGMRYVISIDGIALLQSVNTFQNEGTARIELDWLMQKLGQAELQWESR